ncbi:MAG: PriCT-2 domain-containing protein, partial [Pseudomonadota bacterium]
PQWIEALRALHAATGGSDAGLNIADEWSATGGDAYKGRKDVERKWRSFKTGGGITRGTLAKLAAGYGADLSAIAIKHMPEMPKEDMPDYSQFGVANWGNQKGDSQTGDNEARAKAAPANPGDPIDEKDLPEPPPVASPFELEIPEFPAGLVGDIARYIVSIGRRPQPAIAIGAALVLVGTAAGRLYRTPTGGGTNLYVLGLAPTAAGKDAPLGALSDLLTRAGRGDLIGPSEFISMPAVIDFVKGKPLSACPMDEFGDFMRRINGKRASGFERSVNKLIREMWSKDFGTYTTPQWAAKKSEKIHAPCLSIFGASTPVQFYDA